MSAAAHASAEGLHPDDAEVEAATDSFRYARDLISAEECDRWLEQRGLNFTDLSDSFSRQNLAQQAGETGPEEKTSADNVDESLFFVDSVLADEFSVWGRRLAWRTALAEDNGCLPEASVPVARFWPEAEAGFQTACANLATPALRQRTLQQRWLGFTFLTLEAAEFDSDSAAREAACCIREDGSSLTDVAALNGFPCRTSEAFLDDLPPEWRTALSTARPGDVVPCGSEDTGIVLLRLLERREPKLDDETVRGRIDALLVAAHFQELESRHVRWLINLETTA